MHAGITSLVLMLAWLLLILLDAVVPLSLPVKCITYII